MTVSEGSQQLAAEASVLQADIARIEKQLSQKKSFEHALDEIVKLSHVASRRNTLPGCQNELDRFFKRTRTLLRSRYTNLAFWGATERAARTIQALIPDNKLSKLLREVEEECADRRGETPAEPIRGSFLFEGQLSNEEPEPNHIDQHTGQFQQDLEQAAARVNVAIAAAQRQNGNADIPEGELEAQAIAELLLGSEAPEAHRKAPKAGKRALKQLEVIQSLDAESLARLGGQDTACSICREILGLGEMALVMPCSDAHVFHPDCIKPWMQENNSCPICRHELETDDAEYEYQKVVRKQQAEDDRGSANAQTHNDFLYL